MRLEYQCYCNNVKKTKSGFTIVELLIVIVVIAILAAITIVAYNGIQTRAENNKTITTVGAYAKAFQLYAIDNGQYPSTTGYPCIGDYGSLTGNVCGEVVDGGSTTDCNYSGPTGVNAAFDTLISTYLGAKPSMSLQRMDCNGSVYVGAYVNKNDTNPKDINVQFYLKGDVSCPTINGIAAAQRAQAGATTKCRLNMPTLP